MTDQTKRGEVIIRAKPRPRDLDRLAKVARETVDEIARMDGAIGPDAVALLYVERLYAAVVALGRPV